MKLRNYDPARVSGNDLMTTRVFPLADAEIDDRSLYIPETRLEGRSENAVLEEVGRVHNAFKRAEEYADKQDEALTDEEVERRATELYARVLFIVIKNCFSVYTARLEGDGDEARAEREHLARIGEKVDVDANVAEAISRSAELYSERWVKDNGPANARGLVRAERFHTVQALAAAAILEADEQVPGGASEEEWQVVFDKLYRAHAESGTEHVHALYLQTEAQDILENDIKPVERTFAELRFWAGIAYLETKAEGGRFPDGATAQAPNVELGARTPERLWALSMMPAQTVDRAARGKIGWYFPLDDAPTFKDANNKHTVTYFADGLTQEALREGVNELSPRTADVWRLVTAALLEAWVEGEREPPRVWLDARQLCDTMGFKKHHKGGHHPKNVAIAARALVDLERFHITIPYGAKQYPADASGKRKKTTVQARAQHRVLAVMAKEEARQLFDAEWLPMRWLVTAGEWIKAYPREQFAPLFRALVELPGAYTPDLWAKAIGTELVWQYRQDGGRVQTQRVETMLRQACVLEEARAEKNKKRARDSFEKALDALKARGVCAAWEYDGSDIDLVENASRGWFEIWLQARVIVTPPPEVTKALEGVAKTKKRYRRRLGKA